MTGNDRGRLGDGLDIESELRELRDLLALPEPDLGTVSAVMARIDQEPVPTGNNLQQRVDRLGSWLQNRWRTATVIGVGALLVVLAVSPAGAAIRAWLGFGAVVVEQQQPMIARHRHRPALRAPCPGPAQNPAAARCP